MSADQAVLHHRRRLQDTGLLPIVGAFAPNSPPACCRHGQHASDAPAWTLRNDRTSTGRTFRNEKVRGSNPLSSTNRKGRLTRCDARKTGQSPSCDSGPAAGSARPGGACPRFAAGHAAQLLEIVSGRKELQEVHWISSGGRKASDELR